MAWGSVGEGKDSDGSDVLLDVIWVQECFFDGVGHYDGQC